MNKEIIVTFPICLKTLFFKDLEDIKKNQKKITGYEFIKVRNGKNFWEIKIPISIDGIRIKTGKYAYFVFLLPYRLLEKQLPSPDTFFEKGLCKIEGATLFNKCDILSFTGTYNNNDRSLKGMINYFHPEASGWT